MNLQTFIWLAKVLLGIAKNIPAKHHLPVLIAQDSLYDSEMLASYCRESGAEAFEVHSLGEAEEALRRRPFRLLLLDLQFPDGSGSDFAKKIKPRYPRLPIVFVTSHLTNLDTLPPGRKWSFIAKGDDGGSLMEAVRDCLMSANGMNGDIKNTELLVVAWILLTLSSGCGAAISWYFLTQVPH